jgi:hypothetical protein
MKNSRSRTGQDRIGPAVTAISVLQVLNLRARKGVAECGDFVIYLVTPVSRK